MWLPKAQRPTRNRPTIRVNHLSEVAAAIFNAVSSIWMNKVDSSISCMEAIIAIMVMCRSLPCLASENALQNLKPAYLALVLGLALTEEMSLSWLNASMMIRATPSLSAHSLSSPLGSDTFRRGVLLILTLAGITQGTLQSVLTYGGILGACLVLLANLGARAWYFQNWKPMQYHGSGSFVLAFLYAVGAGMVFPFMGHRLIRTGGKGAMEYVLTTAFFAAVAFVVSDYDAFQKFLVVGSESEVRHFWRLVPSIFRPHSPQFTLCHLK
jgi:hypothetical protein